MLSADLGSALLDAPRLTLRSRNEIMTGPGILRSLVGVVMNDFNRKVEEASARVNKSVAQATERLEKETAELIEYLNQEVVPAVRQHSTKALRVASEKLAALADFLETNQAPPK